MGFKVNVLADSLSPSRVRLTTLEVSYPRIIHGEMLRHRVFSRCAASSRAIPVERFIDQVTHDPYVPTHWGRNQKGMVAGLELPWQEQNHARDTWLKARDQAVEHAKQMLEIGVHKQLTNRLLEPFQWITEVITATEWDNFFHLRIHPAAHPDIQLIARLMKEAIDNSRPIVVEANQWHVPMIKPEDWTTAHRVAYDTSVSDDNIAEATRELIKLASVGRVARVSYLRHNDDSDFKNDVARAQKMLIDGHMSPFEHVALPLSQKDAVERLLVPGLSVDNMYDVKNEETFVGNFRGWVQYRKFIPNESDLLKT